MKRHINEEPHSAFVLNCKKRKTDGTAPVSSAPGETSTILKFAGTLASTIDQVNVLINVVNSKILLHIFTKQFQDADISEHIAKLTKEDAKDIVNRKRQVPNVGNRIDQNREKSQQNRFKIVNYTRALNEPAEESTSNKLTIVDVEKDRTNTTEATTSSSFSDLSDEPFVYDIYIADAAESAVQYPFDMNDLRLVLLDEVYCSYYTYM